MQVPHILALLMSLHRLPLTKWQDLQPCFHDFQRSVLNTPDHKSKGKTAIGVFCISFLSTAQGMLSCLRSPLSSSFFSRTASQLSTRCRKSGQVTRKKKMATYQARNSLQPDTVHRWHHQSEQRWWHSCSTGSLGRRGHGAGASQAHHSNCQGHSQCSPPPSPGLANGKRHQQSLV